MARYKQYRVAVSPVQVVGEGLPSMEVGGGTSLAGAVGWPNSKSRWSRLSKCGVEGGGVVATKWSVTGASLQVNLSSTQRKVRKGEDGAVLGLATKSSLGKMTVFGGEIHARVLVAGLDLAGKQKLPKCHQPSKQQRVCLSRSVPNTLVPSSLDEKEVLRKRKPEKNNTHAWMKKEEKEEELKSKLVLPQPPRLVKRARRRKANSQSVRRADQN